ncbi:SDR family NAD(P)-dependent oxidoreductase [Rhodococcus opacus]|jgi:3alpha(or 20beta)-hydroxysteroid dehydrogenase|uniref:SDR family NAD(P)-dependent oxidoreductase n=1 Tax=Rhodococcus opacus TaxID=37919 RepID=UPI002475ADC5|nr:glucose 1-dehydrogenase [Rhodococcus opacus]MDH6293323.1 3alpha(or 20beta)-hydroxysteroid dehydrogenase [Rhodococcus opacus]
MARLDGKVAIITGAARGQGASHARAFVAEGAKVIIADVITGAGEFLAAELGDNAIFVKLDVTDRDNWNNVIEEAEHKFGPVNVLINNAGIFRTAPIEEVTEEDYRLIISINQVGPFLGMKAVLPSMKKAGGGTIVNISSIGGLGGSLNGVAYVASKHAVRGMSKVAALEFAQHGIRVNTVYPGAINTPMIQQGSATDQSVVEATLAAIPMHRVAEPDEVSKLVLFLASDESSYSTGADFVIDGGVTASV